MNNQVPCDVVSHDTIRVKPEMSAIKLHQTAYKDISNTRTPIL